MSGWNDADIAALRRAVEDRNAAENRIRANVAHLRQQETPWSVIGEALGVSKQAAAKKYGSSRVSLEDRPLPES